MASSQGCQIKVIRITTTTLKSRNRWTSDKKTMSKEQVDVDALFKGDGARDKFKKDLAAYHEISFEEASEILDKADPDEISQTLMEIAEEVCKVSWYAVNHANCGSLTFYMWNGQCFVADEYSSGGCEGPFDSPESVASDLYSGYFNFPHDPDVSDEEQETSCDVEGTLPQERLDNILKILTEE